MTVLPDPLLWLSLVMGGTFALMSLFFTLRVINAGVRGAAFTWPALLSNFLFIAFFGGIGGWLLSFTIPGLFL